MDSKKKSISKTLSWRIIAVILSVIVAYIFTNSLLVSMEIAITSNFLSMIIYYFHERIWADYK